jgi:hypothetical protein
MMMMMTMTTMMMMMLMGRVLLLTEHSEMRVGGEKKEITTPPYRLALMGFEPYPTKYAKNKAQFSITPHPITVAIEVRYCCFLFRIDPSTTPENGYHNCSMPPYLDVNSRRRHCAVLPPNHPSIPLSWYPHLSQYRIATWCGRNGYGSLINFRSKLGKEATEAEVGGESEHEDGKEG